MLNYTYDVNGNVTNIMSPVGNGVNVEYDYDVLNRLTNVMYYASYNYDRVGNLQSVQYYGQYAGPVTNLYQYDSLNRLTNVVWKNNSTTLGRFYYQFGLTGNRTSLSEMVNGVSRTCQWQYDNLYRLTNEIISPIGSVGYAYDGVGNRTSRQSSITQIPTTNYSYNTNDWLATDQYDSCGNTTNSGSIITNTTL